MMGIAWMPRFTVRTTFDRQDNKLFAADLSPMRSIVAQTPLLEEPMLVIGDEGWESQEPARKTVRAVIAGMTEQERVSCGHGMI
jgi:hypothetical protein